MIDMNLGANVNGGEFGAEISRVRQSAPFQKMKMEAGHADTTHDGRGDQLSGLRCSERGCHGSGSGTQREHE